MEWHPREHAQVHDIDTFVAAMRSANTVQNLKASFAIHLQVDKGAMVTDDYFVQFQCKYHTTPGCDPADASTQTVDATAKDPEDIKGK